MVSHRQIASRWCHGRADAFSSTGERDEAAQRQTARVAEKANKRTDLERRNGKDRKLRCAILGGFGVPRKGRCRFGC